MSHEGFYLIEIIINYKFFKFFFSDTDCIYSLLLGLKVCHLVYRSKRFSEAITAHLHTIADYFVTVKYVTITTISIYSKVGLLI